MPINVFFYLDYPIYILILMKKVSSITSVTFFIAFFVFRLTYIFSSFFIGKKTLLSANAWPICISFTCIGNACNFQQIH